MTCIDEPTLQAIVQRWAPALTLYARQWCVCPDDAVQEALIELVRLSFTPDQPVAWLFRVVRCRSQNQGRSQRRREHHEQVAAALRSSWFDATTSRSASIDVDQLTAALASLVSLDREIVIARVWGQLSWAQIADLVERPISTLHRRYAQALRMLKDHLTRSNSPQGDSHEPISESR